MLRHIVCLIMYIINSFTTSKLDCNQRLLLPTWASVWPFMFLQTSCKSQQVCLSQNNSNFPLACEESWRDLSRLCVRPISSVRSNARDPRIANLVTRALVVMRNREKLWRRECKESEPRPALCACFKLESTSCFLAGCVQPPFRSCPSLPPFQRDVRKGLKFRRQRRWSAHSRAHKGLSALAYSLRTKYTAATSILRTAHDLLPNGFVAQSDRMLVELIQRSGLQSKPGSETFSSIPGLSYFPFLNHWWSFSLFSSQKTQFRVLRGLHTLVKSS